MNMDKCDSYNPIGYNFEDRRKSRSVVATKIKKIRKKVEELSFETFGPSSTRIKPISSLFAKQSSRNKPSRIRLNSFMKCLRSIPDRNQEAFQSCQTATYGGM